MEIEILRFNDSGQSTLGLLGVDCDYDWYTLELPWKNNERRVSCIPADRYLLRFRPASESAKFKYDHIEIMGVPGRDYILFHVANYPKDILGCVAVGKVQQENFVGQSTKGFGEFMERVIDEIKKGSTYLTIKYL